MPEYVSSTTNMMVGALISNIIMAGIVACGYALLLNRTRQAGVTKAPTTAQSTPQGLPVKTDAEKTPKTRKEKVAKMKTVKERKIAGGVFFSFLRRKKSASEGEAAQPEQATPAGPVKEKQSKTPKFKAVKEAKQPGDKSEKTSTKSGVQVEKSRKFGLFGRKEAAPKKEASKAASAVPVPPLTDVDVNKPFVMPAAAKATTQPTVADSSAPPPTISEATPAAQPSEGTAPAAPQAAAQPEPATTEPEKKGEGAADSLFNLFNDTEGEESEISKFAANFDDVSVDSLMGDIQTLLGHISKN